MELRVMELGLARASSRERSGGALPPTSRAAAAAWLGGMPRCNRQAGRGCPVGGGRSGLRAGKSQALTSMARIERCASSSVVMGTSTSAGSISLSAATGIASAAALPSGDGERDKLLSRPPFICDLWLWWWLWF